jgi:hypothetical protein
MSDYDQGLEEEAAHDRRGKVLLQAVLGLLVLVGAMAALYFWHDRYNITSEERFEREVAENKDAAVVLVPLRTLYPYEYRRLRQETTEAYNLEKEGLVLDRLPFDFLDGFRKRHAAEALMGGDAESLAFAAAYAALFEEAAKNKALCEVMFGNEDKISDPAVVLKQKPFTRMYAAFITLAASGKKQQIRREQTKFADLQAFWGEVRKLNPKPKYTYPLQPADRCQQANFTGRAIMAQPEERRIKLIAILLQGWR